MPADPGRSAGHRRRDPRLLYALAEGGLVERALTSIEILDQLGGGLDRQFALFAHAVLAGRAGRAAEASEAVAKAVRVGAPYAMGVHLGLRLVSEAAIADSWGTHAEWLREAEDYFHTADVPAVASACRALLRGSGQRVARRRGGVAEVPQSLRAAGVTRREYEVLRFLAERFGNREIAERLHLSTRTVEGHISSLINKTGLPNRRALSRLALSGGDEVGPVPGVHTGAG